MTENNQQQPLSRVIFYAMKGEERHNLKKGMSKHSEHYAYPFILPRLGEENIKHETVALRLAALIAESKIKQVDGISLGKYLRLNAPKEGKLVETRLTLMMNMNAEDAIVSLSRIFAYLSSSGTGKAEGFNWYRLGNTLAYWGNGLTENSLANRQSILRDYYITSIDKDEEDSGAQE